MSIQLIACYIIKNYSKKSIDGISPLKLQKVLYYNKVWGLISGTPLIEENFEKWKYGPVNYAIYNEYKKFGNKPIPVPCKDTQKPDNTELINFITENYIEFDAITLSALTHKEEPWIKTPNDSIILNEYIFDYYSKQPFAKNFPLDEKKQFYPILADLNHAYIFDMSPEDSKLSTVFKSYNEYKKFKQKAKIAYTTRIKNFV